MISKWSDQLFCSMYADKFMIAYKTEHCVIKYISFPKWILFKDNDTWISGHKTRMSEMINFHNSCKLCWQGNRKFAFFFAFSIILILKLLIPIPKPFFHSYFNGWYVINNFASWNKIITTYFKYINPLIWIPNFNDFLVSLFSSRGSSNIR